MEKEYCYGCRQPIDGRVQWLEEDNEIEGEWRKHPFHPACADQPWPMSECAPPPAVVQSVTKR